MKDSDYLNELQRLYQETGDERFRNAYLDFEDIILTFERELDCETERNDYPY